MRWGIVFGWAILGGFAIAACGSSSDGTTGGGACTPGDSKACVGPGGCSGGQPCNASGTGYGDCNCGSSGGDAGSGTDSGSSSDGSSDSGSFTPASLSGLALWAEASRVETDAGPIAWPDQSGHGQTFTIPSGGPTYVESSTIAGGPAIRFVLANNDELRAPLGNFTSTDYVVELVVNTTASSSQSPLVALQGSSASGGFLLYAGGGQTFFDTGEAFMGAYTNSATHVFGIRESGGSASLRIDGTASTPTVTSGASGTSSTVTLGALNGDIAEVVVATTPSTADISQLEAYLKSKYGL